MLIGSSLALSSNFLSLECFLCGFEMMTACFICEFFFFNKLV